MTLQETVRNAILKHPSIFNNALTVYNHLFCVIGNGYEWVDGELVSKGKEKPVESIREAVKEYLKYSLLDSQSIHPLIKNSDAYKKRLMEEVDVIFDVIRNSKNFSIPPNFIFYPLSNSSKMCCFPEDIKPDWKNGIIRLVKIMEENPELVEDDKLWLPKVKERLKII